MKFVRVLPLYAVSALLAAALALVSTARDWSAGETLLAAALLSVVYLATVVVPWLLREHGRPSRKVQQPITIGSAEVTAHNGTSSAVNDRESYRGSAITPERLHPVGR